QEEAGRDLAALHPVFACQESIEDPAQVRRPSVLPQKQRAVGRIDDAIVELLVALGRDEQWLPLAAPGLALGRGLIAQEYHHRSARLGARARAGGQAKAANYQYASVQHECPRAPRAPALCVRRQFPSLPGSSATSSAPSRRCWCR